MLRSYSGKPYKEKQKELSRHIEDKWHSITHQANYTSGRNLLSSSETSLGIEEQHHKVM